VRYETYSLKLNSVFSDIIGTNRTIPDKLYLTFYPKLMSYFETWKHSTIRLWDITNCLQNLAKNSYKQLCTKLKGEDDALEALENIY
jgi:hypothetical protein